MLHAQIATNKYFLFILTNFHGLYISLTYCFYNKDIGVDIEDIRNNFLSILSKISPVLKILSKRPCIITHPITVPAWNILTRRLF